LAAVVSEAKTNNPGKSGTYETSYGEIFVALGTVAGVQVDKSVCPICVVALEPFPALMGDEN